MGFISFFNNDESNCLNPQDLISTDLGNSIVLGTDNKLFNNSIIGGGEGGSYSLTKYDVKSGDKIIINKKTDAYYSSAGVITVWEYTEDGTLNVLETICEYNKLNQNLFFENGFIEFDKTEVKLKTDYTKSMEYEEMLAEDMHIYSAIINLDSFKKFKVV